MTPVRHGVDFFDLERRAWGNVGVLRVGDAGGGILVSLQRRRLADPGGVGVLGLEPPWMEPLKGSWRRGWWPGDKFLRFPGGATVRTTNDAGATDWTEVARLRRRWGAPGVVIRHHDSHGLVYEVRHEDGTVGCYEQEELVLR